MEHSSTGVVGALSVALLLLVAPNLLQYLPSAALAAVVIASAIGLFENLGPRPENVGLGPAKFGCQ